MCVLILLNGSAATFHSAGADECALDRVVRPQWNPASHWSFISPPRKLRHWDLIRPRSALQWQLACTRMSCYCSVPWATVPRYQTCISSTWLAKLGSETILSTTSLRYKRILRGRAPDSDYENNGSVVDFTSRLPFLLSTRRGKSCSADELSDKPPQQWPGTNTRR